MEHPVVLEPSCEQKEILNMIKSMVNVNTDSRMVIHECSQNFTVVNRELVCRICKVKMLDKILEVLPNLDQQKIRILYRDDIESNTNLTATDKPVNVEINDNLLKKEELDEEANSEEANSEESEYSSEEDRDEFSNVEDMNPLNECDTFYNAEH